MHSVRGLGRGAIRALTLIVLVWSLLSAIAALLVFVMLRERYGRKGPIAVGDAPALLHPLRRFLHEPVPALLAAFGVKPGDTALEVGPGPGYFTLEAARVVGPTGRMVALDVQPGMLAILDGRLRAESIANAHPIAGDAARLPLADHCVDVAFLVTVLGEIPDRPAALFELRRVLRHGGVLSIMEGMNDPDYQLEASVRDVCRAIGFEERERRSQRFGYVLTFVAP